MACQWGEPGRGLVGWAGSKARLGGQEKLGRWLADWAGLELAGWACLMARLAGCAWNRAGRKCLVGLRLAG